MLALYRHSGCSEQFNLLLLLPRPFVAESMMTDIGTAVGEDETVAPAPDRLAVTSVGLFLCPNRNLTTLTAAVLSLHPHVQVLNHGFERLQAAGLLRFLHSNRDEDLEAFVRGAIGMSGYGRRGDYGGNILLSHAFDRPALRSAYAQRYADAPLKPKIRCVIWKDGARLQEYIKANNIDPVAVAERLPRLRFISPLRQPLAHLRSLQRYYATELPDYVRPSLPDLSPESVARYILSAHADFLNWSERLPTQFFSFSEADLDSNGALRLLAFLSMAGDQAWERCAARHFVNDGPSAEHGAESSIFESLLLAEFSNRDRICRWYLQSASLPLSKLKT
jgi:hypothetical protein